MSKDGNNSGCACKGIRSCLMCEQTKKKLPDKVEPPEQQLHHTRQLNLSEIATSLVYTYCPACRDKAWLDSTDHRSHRDSRTAPDHSGGPITATDAAPVVDELATPKVISISGVYVVNESISEEQEQYLVSKIDGTNWVVSQSGRRKQDFGPKANFKRKKCKLGNFTGLPLYIKDVFDSLKLTHREVLQDFIPVELCNLDYEPSRGAAIDPHKDDDWLWGNRLVTINYSSPTVLTLTREEKPGLEIAINLPPRSLLVLADEARYDWLHAIQRNHITARRLATTLRELTPRFLPGGEEYETTGRDILAVAGKFIET